MKLKKYVKSMIVFLITLLGIILGILLGIRFLQFFMPFVIGWIIAMIANPLVRMLERRLKVARKHTSMVIIIGVLAVIIVAIYFLGVKIGEETRSFLEQAPEMYSEFREEFQDAGKNLESIISELPQNIQESLEEAQKDIGDITGQAVGKISQFTVDKAGTFARNIPGILISIIFSILSAYFDHGGNRSDPFYRDADPEGKICYPRSYIGGLFRYASLSWDRNGADSMGGI